ncbi:uncharacterized protein LOC118184601 [Stegodyphus dumicola]|uniref:uncharacterized protein LOC118184601 n=1 Tax=Stegodyphus dumicola TaxID=202533 RepID=UPI0015A7B9A8|nr:uncharacterized protein LOC118184601 [Stegodyphus dumicola]
MTDDDKTTHPAFDKVFGPGITHLLCKWHVHRAWQRNLCRMVSNQKLKDEIYFNMVVLLEETNSARFIVMMDNFLQKFRTIAPSFIQYFEEHYYSRAILWSMAHRNFPHAFTDTNMYCESFHNKLKTTYFRRKFNRRLDKLIEVLLKIEEDTYMAHSYKIKTNYKQSTCPPTYNKRHDSGIKILDSDVTGAGFLLWIVKSQTSNIQYTVKCLYELCPQTDHCYSKCISLSCLNLCSHLYNCNCPDFSPLCKHIHKVHSVRQRDPSFFVTDTYKSESCSSAIQTGTKSVISNAVACNLEHKIDNCKTLISELQVMLPNPTVKKILLPTITKNLKEIVSNCKGVIESNYLKEFPDKMPFVSVPPNLKLARQTLFRTTASKSAKRKISTYLNIQNKKKNR